MDIIKYIVTKMKSNQIRRFCISCFGFFLLLNFSNIGLAQNYISPPGYMYKKTVEKHIRNEKQHHINNFIIYQTSLKLLGIENEIKGVKNDDLLTFIISETAKLLKIHVYVNNVFLKKGFINYDPFSYKEMSQLGVIKKEYSLYFVPPIINSEKNEIFIFSLTNRGFYFELWDFLSYTPNEQRQAKRELFAKKLKPHLKNMLMKIVVE